VCAQKYGHISSKGEPYAPAHFLYTMWRFANHLAGYEQQVRVGAYAHIFMYFRLCACFYLSICVCSVPVCVCVCVSRTRMNFLFPCSMAFTRRVVAPTASAIASYTGCSLENYAQVCAHALCVYSHGGMPCSFDICLMRYH